MINTEHVNQLISALKENPTRMVITKQGYLFEENPTIMVITKRGYLFALFGFFFKLSQVHVKKQKTYNSEKCEHVNIINFLDRFGI
jgi:hypothetical protein